MATPQTWYLAMSNTPHCPSRSCHSVAQCVGRYHASKNRKREAANGGAAIAGRNPIRKFSIDRLEASKASGKTRSHLTSPCRQSQRKPIRKFSIDSTSSIRTSIADTFLRTPFPRLPICTHDVLPSTFLIPIGEVRCGFSRSACFLGIPNWELYARASQELPLNAHHPWMDGNP